MLFENREHFLEELAKSLEELFEKADKPSKADIWKQTVAFLAPHNKGYAAIHEKNLAADKKPEAKGPPKSAPTKPGTRGEMAQTKGSIGSKSVAYPLKDESGKPTGKNGYKKMAVQDTHHWKHNGEKWEHSHTTTSGEGLNKK